MILQSILGLITFLAIAWAVSENRRGVPWRTVAAGVGLQFVLAILLLKLPASQGIFFFLNRILQLFTEATGAGTSFVFGYIGGGDLPFETSTAGSTVILAFQTLPLVLIISAVSALLFYWRIMPFIVNGLSFILRRSLHIGGAAAIGAAANIFVGMTEAPLLVRPYLSKLSRGELFMLMTCGMATIAGTVMALYASILSNIIPDALGHILTASLINAPAAIAIATLTIPPNDKVTEAELISPDPVESTMDAITKGTIQGVQLLLNITAMLLVLVALVSLVNLILGLLPEIGGAPVTMQRALGLLMAPVVWLMGIPWGEAQAAGALMGTKTVLNELIAYTDLANLPAAALTDKSRLIMTYAMCGFANFGSLGIMIGGMGTMAPERRAEIASLGLKSIASGTLATCMTGAVVCIVSP